MAVNLRGVFLGCKRAIGEMVEQEPVGEVRGRVIDHLVAARDDRPARATSHTPRARAARQPRRTSSRSTSAKRGILVNAVAPGKILTGNPEGMRPELLEYSHARTPFPRLGRPDDVAGAALFLASDDAGYVSGINLLVDGGWMAY